MNKVVLVLGSNLGERLSNIEKATVEIDLLLGKISQQSSVYETAPWGNTNQPVFLNCVVVIASTHGAEEIMKKIISIEESIGRRRSKKWEPRSIDIDVLFFNDEVIETEILTVPHPNLQSRRFVLIPLTEIMPGYVHPQLKKTMQELLDVVNDPLEVKKISANFA